MGLLPHLRAPLYRIQTPHAMAPARGLNASLEVIENPPVRVIEHDRKVGTWRRWENITYLVGGFNPSEKY